MSTIASFVERLSTIKVENLWSMFQLNIHSINASASKYPVCGCDTSTNLLLRNNMLKWKLINVEQKIDYKIKDLN